MDGSNSKTTVNYLISLISLYSRFFKEMGGSNSITTVNSLISLISLYSRFYKEMGGSNSKYLCIPGSTRRWVDLILKLQ